MSGPGIATTTVGVVDAAGANFTGAFARGSNSAGNYVRFGIDATGFTLQATPTTPEGGIRRAPLNGIEIVPLSWPPQPSPIGIDFNGNSTSVMFASETAGVVEQSHAGTAPQVLSEPRHWRWQMHPGAPRRHR